MSEEKFSLDPKETAVVFIEYQNEFTTEGGKLHEAVKPCMEAVGTLANSKKVLDAARKAGALVVHVPIEFEKVCPNQPLEHFIGYLLFSFKSIFNEIVT